MLIYLQGASHAPDPGHAPAWIADFEVLRKVPELLGYVHRPLPVFWWVRLKLRDDASITCTCTWNDTLAICQFPTSAPSPPCSSTSTCCARGPIFCVCLKRGQQCPHVDAAERASCRPCEPALCALFVESVPLIARHFQKPLTLLESGQAHYAFNRRVLRDLVAFCSGNAAHGSCISRDGSSR